MTMDPTGSLKRNVLVRDTSGRNVWGLGDHGIQVTMDPTGSLKWDEMRWFQVQMTGTDGPRILPDPRGEMWSQIQHTGSSVPDYTPDSTSDNTPDPPSDNTSDQHICTTADTPYLSHQISRLIVVPDPTSYLARLIQYISPS